MGRVYRHLCRKGVDKELASLAQRMALKVRHTKTCTLKDIIFLNMFGEGANETNNETNNESKYGALKLLIDEKLVNRDSEGFYVLTRRGDSFYES